MKSIGRSGKGQNGPDGGDYWRLDIDAFASRTNPHSRAFLPEAHIGELESGENMGVVFDFGSRVDRRRHKV